MRKAYLDTSVIRKNFSGTKGEKRRIQEKVSSHSKLTSKYVRQEYLKGYFLAIVDLYFALWFYKAKQNKEDSKTTIDDAFRYFVDSYKAREVKANATILIDAFTNIGDRKNFERALRICKSYLKNTFIRFELLFQRYDMNTTKCAFADVIPEFDKYNDIPSFKRHLKELFYKKFKDDLAGKCQAVQLLKNEKTNLEAVMQHGDLIWSADKKTELKEIAEEKRRMTCGRCKKFADVFVTLECPSNAKLFTMDKFFGIAAPIFKKDYEIIETERGQTKVEDIRAS